MRLWNRIKLFFTDYEIVSSYNICFELKTIEGNNVLEIDQKIVCDFLDNSPYSSMIRNKLEKVYKEDYNALALKLLKEYRAKKTIKGNKKIIYEGKDIKIVEWYIYSIETKPLTIEQYEHIHHYGGINDQEFFGEEMIE